MTRRRKRGMGAGNPDSGPGLWHPSAWYLAGVVHLFVSACVMLVAHLEGWDMGWTAAILLIAAAVKEFAIDLSPLEGDTVAGSSYDFTTYALGMGIGLVAVSWSLVAGVLGMVGTVIVLMAIDIWKERKAS